MRAQFPNVALYEQQSIVGSAIVAERTMRSGIEGFESIDGFDYRHSESLPSPHSFVALASAGVLPEANGNLLFDRSYLAELHGSISALTSRLGDATDRAERAEERAALLRASVVRWAEEAGDEEKATPAACPVTARSQRGVGDRTTISRRLGRLLERATSAARKPNSTAAIICANPDVAEAGIDPYETI